MEFTLHDPPPQLADRVKLVWCARGTKAEFEAPEPIVPDGCVEIIINLGARFVNAETREVQPRDLLAGQMTRPVVALPTGDVDLIGVRFKTGRAGAALGMQMSELQDRLIAASDAVGGIDRVADDLLNVDHASRLDRLSAVLVERLNEIDTGTMHAVDHALAIIDAAQGAVTIDEVAGRVGISRRHLERQFRRHVGLGAKHIARISRIHNALDHLQRHPLMSGAEIAAACGYSDQAHLVRECRELTGQTPTRLWSTRPSLSGLMRS